MARHAKATKVKSLLVQPISDEKCKSHKYLLISYQPYDDDQDPLSSMDVYWICISYHVCVCLTCRSCEQYEVVSNIVENHSKHMYTCTTNDVTHLTSADSDRLDDDSGERSLLTGVSTDSSCTVSR